MNPANDDTPPPPRLVPLIGTLNIDTGTFEAARVVQLISEDMLRPFPNDPREA